MVESYEKVTENSLKDLINSLISVIVERDPFMKEHAERVATTCVLLSRKLALPQQEVNQIYLAGLLHDIGIVYIPQSIVHKRENLTEEELEIIKRHPLISEKIVSKYSILKSLLPAIRHHHEAVNGTGYPDGLKGNQIPISAQILGLVNYFDSITRTREGRPSVSKENALREIRKKAGQQFDKGLANEFIKFIQLTEDKMPTNGKESFPADSVNNKQTIERKEPENREEPDSVKEVIQDIIKRFKSGEIDLPVLPKVIQEIQEEMSKPSTTVSGLAAVIEKDAIVSVRLISVANSPLYRGTERIATVKQAIPRLGMKETQTAVNAIANKSLFSARGNIFKLVMEKLWLHSLASAYATRTIAARAHLGDAEKFFFLGLIHDIGKALLFKAFDNVSSNNSSMDIDEIMEGVQETHTSFGGAILRKWGFSEGFARVSLLHEGPDFRNDTDKEILAVNIASNIAHRAGFGLNGKEVIKHNPVAAKLLDIDPETTDEIEEEIKKQMEDISDIF